MVSTKKILIGGTFLCFLLVLACRKDEPIDHKTLKTSLMSDPSFLKYKVLQDSLKIGIFTRKYNLSKTDLVKVHKTVGPMHELQQTYEKAGMTNAKEYLGLCMRLSILNRRLLKKYPALRSMSKEEIVKTYNESGLHSPFTDNEMNRIIAAGQQRRKKK